MRWVLGAGLIFATAGLAAATAPCEPVGAPASVLRRIDLAQPFSTRSPWRLVVAQGPPTEDYGGNPAPGEIRLCLQKALTAACNAAPVSAARPSTQESADWSPHYLISAAPVHPRGSTAAPLLELVTASVHAGDGGQVVVTQLLAYDRADDAFHRIYVHDTGTNNNQEVRFIASGPLQGSVVSAEPTNDAPYAYWITVNRLTPARTYRQALRYRSATRYQDGNALAVIDAEMPGIERRLALWRPGEPLPLPAGKPCPRPNLRGMALWCG